MNRLFSEERVGLLGHISQDVFNIFLAEAADLLGQWDEACCALEKGEDTREALLWVMRTAQSLRRASRGVGLDDLAQALGSTEELVRELLKSDLQPHRTVLDTLQLAHTTLSRWLAGVRTDADYVEDITALGDAIRICRSGLQRAASEAQNIGGSVADERNLFIPSRVPDSTAGAAAPFSALTQQRIEDLIDTVGRIATQHGVIAAFQNRSEQTSAEFSKALETSFRLSAELQAKAVRLRMHPLSRVFEKLEDFILDLAEERHIALQMDAEGQDVELDEALIEGLWKPLIELVHAVFDVGFDSPEERVKAGKLPSLFMRLSANSEGGVVVITLDDDGRGISENESSLSAGELKERLERIRSMLSPISATLKVVTHRDRSASYQISLPESLRLLDLVVVKSQNQCFALPSHLTDELIEPGQFHTHTLRGDKQFIEYNSKIYPFVTLCDLLEHAPPTQRPRVQASLAIERGHVILLRCGREPIALGIDGVVASQRSIITPLAAHLRHVRGLLGTLTSGDGEPVIVVDIVEITDAFWAAPTERDVA
jgi:chemotaxis protein histidine kinase CheA